MMTLDEMWQAAVDFWRGCDYGLKEYVIRDGKKHPFALVCPGGAYEMICSFIEGLPYVKQLNKLEYSAFVLYYRCQKKARFPAPQDDIARALRDILSRAEESNLDTEGYSVWGSSAGGHVASSFGTESMGSLWTPETGGAGAHLPRGDHERPHPRRKPEESAGG